MIKAFTCSNFRNVRADNLHFGHINILIGPNNSGKSNFIRALSFSANMMNSPNKDPSGFLAEIHRNGSQQLLRHGAKNNVVSLKWEISLPDQDVEYGLNFRVGQTDQECYIINEAVDSAMHIPGYDKPFNYFRFHDGKPGYGMFSTAQQLGQLNKRVHVIAKQSESALLQFNSLVMSNQELLEQKYVTKNTFSVLEQMRYYFSKFYSYTSSKFDFEKIRQLQDPNGSDSYLLKDGSNLLNVYQKASKTDPSFQDRFVAKMKSMISNLEKIEVVSGLDKIGMKLHMNGSSYYLSEVSDGTIEAIILALLTSMPDQLAPSLLAIDEPEVNLHPAWQSVLAKWLLTSGNFSQCFISTHSSDFLDSFTEGFKEKLVSIFVYDNLSGTFKPLDRNRINEELDKGWLLGDLYRVNDPSIGGWPW